MPRKSKKKRISNKKNPGVFVLPPYLLEKLGIDVNQINTSSDITTSSFPITNAGNTYNNSKNADIFKIPRTTKSRKKNQESSILETASLMTKSVLLSPSFVTNTCVNDEEKAVNNTINEQISINKNEVFTNEGNTLPHKDKMKYHKENCSVIIPSFNNISTSERVNDSNKINIISQEIIMPDAIQNINEHNPNKAFMGESFIPIDLKTSLVLNNNTNFENVNSNFIASNHASSAQLTVLDSVEESDSFTDSFSEDKFLDNIITEICSSDNIDILDPLENTKEQEFPISKQIVVTDDFHDRDDACENFTDDSKQNNLSTEIDTILCNEPKLISKCEAKANEWEKSQSADVQNIFSNTKYNEPASSDMDLDDIDHSTLIIYDTSNSLEHVYKPVENIVIEETKYCATKINSSKSSDFSLNKHGDYNYSNVNNGDINSSDILREMLNTDKTDQFKDNTLCLKKYVNELSFKNEINGIEKPGGQPNSIEVSNSPCDKFLKTYKPNITKQKNTFCTAYEPCIVRRDDIDVINETNNEKINTKEFFCVCYDFGYLVENKYDDHIHFSYKKYDNISVDFMNNEMDYVEYINDAVNEELILEDIPLMSDSIPFNVCWHSDITFLNNDEKIAFLQLIQKTKNSHQDFVQEHVYNIGSSARRSRSNHSNNAKAKPQCKLNDTKLKSILLPEQNLLKPDIDKTDTLTSLDVSSDLQINENYLSEKLIESDVTNQDDSVLKLDNHDLTLETESISIIVNDNKLPVENCELRLKEDKMSGNTKNENTSNVGQTDLIKISENTVKTKTLCKEKEDENKKSPRRIEKTPDDKIKASITKRSNNKSVGDEIINCKDTKLSETDIVNHKNKCNNVEQDTKTTKRPTKYSDVTNNPVKEKCPVDPKEPESNDDVLPSKTTTQQTPEILVKKPKKRGRTSKSVALEDDIPSLSSKEKLKSDKNDEIITHETMSSETSEPIKAIVAQRRGRLSKSRVSMEDALPSCSSNENLNKIDKKSENTTQEIDEPPDKEPPQSEKVKENVPKKRGRPSKSRVSLEEEIPLLTSKENKNKSDKNDGNTTQDINEPPDKEPPQESSEKVKENVPKKRGRPSKSRVSLEDALPSCSSNENLNITDKKNENTTREINRTPDKETPQSSEKVKENVPKKRGRPSKSRVSLEEAIPLLISKENQNKSDKNDGNTTQDINEPPDKEPPQSSEKLKENVPKKRGRPSKSRVSVSDSPNNSPCDLPLKEIVKRKLRDSASGSKTEDKPVETPQDKPPKIPKKPKYKQYLKCSPVAINTPAKTTNDSDSSTDCMPIGLFKSQNANNAKEIVKYSPRKKKRRKISSTSDEEDLPSCSSMEKLNKSANENEITLETMSPQSSEPMKEIVPKKDRPSKSRVSMDTVECGVCNQVISCEQWSNHLMGHHYLAWKKSEEKPNLESINDKLSFINEHMKKSKVLICSGCQTKYTIARYFLSHINDCSTLLTKNYVMGKGKCVCSFCKEEIKPDKWIDHSMKKHYNLAWVEGQREHDLKSSHSIKKLIKQYKSVSKTLRCNECGKVMSSELGFFSHVIKCGKRDEDYSKWTEKCKICSVSYLCAYKQQHYNGHRVKLTEETDNLKKSSKGLQPFDDDEPLIDGETVECGVCGKTVNSTSWHKHIMQQHQYIAWKKDEPKIDVNDELSVNTVLKKVISEQGYLQCGKCQQHLARAHNYIAHCKKCYNVGSTQSGKDVEAKEILNPIVDEEGNYTCGVCSEKVQTEMWKKHAVTTHYNVTWRKGEEPVDVRNPYAASACLRAYKKDPNKLSCHNCGLSRSSHIGFYTHILTCGKTKQEIAQWMNRCNICNKDVLCVYEKAHMSWHIDKDIGKFKVKISEDEIKSGSTTPVVVKEEVLTKGRKAAIRAMEVIGSIQSTGTSDSNKHHCSKCGFGCENISNFKKHSCTTDVCKEGSDSSSEDESSGLPTSDDETQNIEETITNKRKKKHKKAPGIKNEIPFQIDEQLSQYLEDGTAKFFAKHYSQGPLFPELRTSNYAVLSREEVSEYLPKINESCEISLHGESTRIKMFEGVKVKEPCLFAGGSVRVMRWVPEHELVAIVAHHDDVPRLVLDQAVKHPALIQIWDLQPNRVPSLCMGIAHSFGTVWSMAWCPSGCNDGPDFDPADGRVHRMGLLAVACSNGIVYVLAVPHPRSVAVQTPVFCKLSPVAELRRNLSLKDVNYQATAVSWNQEKGHELLCVGYSDGEVCQFNLSDNSPLALVQSEGVFVRMPFSSERASSSCISSVVNYNSCWGAGSTSGSVLVANDEVSRNKFVIHTDAAVLAPLWPTIFSVNDDVKALEMSLSCTKRNIQLSDTVTACYHCCNIVGVIDNFVVGFKTHPVYIIPPKWSIAKITLAPLKEKKIKSKSTKDDCKVKVEPYTYEDAVKEYRIKVYTNANTPIETPRGDHKTIMRPERYPLAAVTALEYCSQRNNHHLLAIALHCGFVMLVDDRERLYSTTR